MINGFDLARMFSDYEEDEERLYSTGDDELDDLLEKAFSDGYEFAQREFAEEEEEDKPKKLSKKAKIALGIAGGTAAIVGGKYVGKALQKKAAKMAAAVETRGRTAEEVREAAKGARGVYLLSRGLQAPADAIVEGSKKAKNVVVEGGKKAKDVVVKAFKKIKPAKK